MTTLKDINNALFPTDIYATIAFIDTTGREIQKLNKRLYTIHLKDESSIMKMTIWDAEILKPLKEGQKIMITKASVTIYQNEPQLSLARDGKIEIVG